MSDPHERGMFPALLKHWRRQRGLSQLDLALAADVSARHVSFLETGRSVPSAEMVIRLAATLGVPLHHVNAMMRAAGYDACYDEPGAEIPGEVADALSLLKDHHEPYPLIVLDRTYCIRDLNNGAASLLGALLGDRFLEGVTDVNLARVAFDANGAQPLLANFDDVGRELLWRIQREVLADPTDIEMRQLLDDLLAMPTVAPNWRDVDLSRPSSPALRLELAGDGFEAHFITMVTTFQAPQNVAVENLRIESWFPCDEATAALCEQLSGAGSVR
jgi:transcriptional regulator with XRE-family HTH domain